MFRKKELGRSFKNIGGEFGKAPAYDRYYNALSQMNKNDHKIALNFYKI